MGLNESIELHPQALQSLMAYNWPGNVRELQNVIARSLILCENGVINNSDLPQNIGQTFSVGPESTNGSLKNQLRNYEIAIIQAAIDGAIDSDGKAELEAFLAESE